MAFTPEQEAALLNLIAQPAKIISDLESEVSLNGDELIPVEDGSGTFGATVNDIADYTIDQIPAATESVAGIAEIATQAETNAGSDDTRIVTPLKLAAKPALPVQIVNFSTGAVASASGAIPFDDTIPQNTEGNQYLSLSITPKSVTNKLKIDVTFHSAVNSSERIQIALFKDSIANALMAVNDVDASINAGYCTTFSYFMTAGTTSSTTFKVRAGSAAGTLTMNGSNGSRLFGGVLISSITITEYQA